MFVTALISLYLLNVDIIFVCERGLKIFISSSAVVPLPFSDFIIKSGEEGEEKENGGWCLFVTLPN